MRPLLLFVFSVVFSLSVKGQDAPDFTITDIDGNSHNLYTELNAGKTVVLKFFTNWCSICNATADQVESLWQGYETNGDPVVLWALDRDQNETNTHATTYRDNNNLTFPVIGEAYSVAQLYGVVYQPEYYIVCPDKSFVKKTSISQVDGVVQSCLALGTGINDLSEQDFLKVLGNTIEWNVAAANTAQLSIIDVNGKVVLTKMIAGGDKVEIDAATGVYFYQLVENNQVVTKGKIPVVR